MTMEESTRLLVSPILQKVLPIRERKGPGKRTNCLNTLACSQLLAIISFKGGASGKKKNPLANAGDVSLTPGWGRFPGEGNGNPLQYSCLENSMDRGAWWATVHRVANSRTN